MDRNLLHTVIALLTVAIAVVYVQKTNPDFFADMMGKKPDAWIKDDPGWDRQPARPLPPPIIEEPKAAPPIQQPEQQPQQQPQQRRRFLPGCPGCP